MIIRSVSILVFLLLPVSTFANAQQDPLYYLIHPSGRDDTDAIQAALDKKDKPVHLASGVFNISKSLVVYRGSSLIGNGSADPNVASSSTLRLLPGTNMDAIVRAPKNENNPYDYMHWLTIANLRIDGNKQQNKAGNCINLGKLGNNSLLTRLLLSKCPESGIKLNGPAVPVNLTQISVFQCGQYGVNFEAAGAQSVYIRDLAGDDNEIALLRIANASGSDHFSIVIENLRAENYAEGKQETGVILESMNWSKVTFISPQFHRRGKLQPGGSGIHIKGKTGVRLTMIGASFENVRNAIVDDIRKKTIKANTRTFSVYTEDIDVIHRINLFSRNSNANATFTVDASRLNINSPKDNANIQHIDIYGPTGKAFEFDAGKGQFVSRRSLALGKDGNNIKAVWSVCDGGPENVLAAPKGSVCSDTKQGKLYFKRSGAGKTGWVRLDK